MSQIKGLNIYVNMKFHEIDDSDRIGRDVTEIGTRGNGDMEISISEKEKISSLIDIIEQSYDKQVGFKV